MIILYLCPRKLTKYEYEAIISNLNPYGCRHLVDWLCGEKEKQ